ncbi:hypothetical protein [Pseudomonas sp. NBRC 111142]|uniref:hypothetical protein n=1 Tax=Pseudomonas sp. NBRC 111142 TaxID=1661057 RepID=UPI0006D40644|nr:hypothetical protein [Pseudomonas sp. NBRC 111142]
MDIDTTGFEHGIPTQVEMLKHQSHLLIAENDELRTKLEIAQANIAKLIAINKELNDRASSEFLRANRTYIRTVQIQNRLRCIHAIDISDWFKD